MPEITNRLNYIFLSFMLLEYWSDGVMDISDFELIVLYGVYVGILWLTFRTENETPFLSILHHSNTPAILDGSLPAEPNSSAAALNTKIINYQSPDSDRLCSCSGLALLPAMVRRSVWTTQDSARSRKFCNGF